MPFLETVEQGLGTLSGYIWNWPVVVLCLGGGLYFTIRFGFIQFRGFAHAWKILTGRYDKANEPGNISHLQALSTAVSATVGLGNIAGVAIAIKMGGPGAVFWMWVVGLLGMATKFTECTLSSELRAKMPDGELRGGPMYYITQGLGKNWKWMAAAFAFFCMTASFGIGNMFQSNQTAQALSDYFNIPAWVTGLTLAILLGLVIIGGIKRIGQVAGFMVPFMCITYVVGALSICVMHIDQWGAMLQLIFADAFAPAPIAGGTLGAVIIWGVRRAIFSSEAGMGSAPIAHAAAKTEYGVRQGIVALLEPFIDTIVICSATASVILLSGLYTGDTTGVTLTANAFDRFYPGFGNYFVTFAVTLFAFSTAISWSYYGEVSANYLFGEKAAFTYKGVYVLLFFLGALWKVGAIINFSDVMNAMMVIPNIIALLFLSNKVKKLTDDYFHKLKAGEFAKGEPEEIPSALRASQQ